MSLAELSLGEDNVAECDPRDDFRWVQDFQVREEIEDPCYEEGEETPPSLVQSKNTNGLEFFRRNFMVPWPRLILF